MFLGIETSCDDTSCAILTDKSYVKAMVSAHQDALHRPFGGIVPEIASRNHTLVLMALIDEALHKAGIQMQDIQGIAVTNRPGLLGSLLVGVVTAKTLSLIHDTPFIGIHHIEGHIMAPFLSDESYQSTKDWTFPFLSLVVSGGHTSLYLVKEFLNYELLGSTIDDAAGEAFDKFAKMLGLSYPGGVQIDKLSKSGDPDSYVFPRALLNEESYNFSFSGLKTAAQNLLQKMSEEEKQKNIHNLCASFQKAIVDVLVHRMNKAILKYGVKSISVTGGVSANSLLRSEIESLAQSKTLNCAIPPLRYCTDNAAMIARAGIERFKKGQFSRLDLQVVARSEISS